MVSWLKQFANHCGVILSFADDCQTEIRLPLRNKKLVHQAYCESMEKEDHPAYLQLPLTYKDFVSVWKKRKEGGNGFNSDSIRWKLLKTAVSSILIIWILQMGKKGAVAIQLGTSVIVYRGLF